MNIVGSLAGILLFTACSWWELGPVWWFGGVLAAIAYLQKLTVRLSTAVLALTSVAILLARVLRRGAGYRAFRHDT